MNNASFVGSFAGEGAAGVASLDPPLIQQTKSEIRTLASEIAKLAHTAFEPAEFYRGFLPRLVTAMGAEGAAVWQTIESLRNRGELGSDDDVSQHATLQLLAQHCLTNELTSSDPKDENSPIFPSESHRRILDCVIAEGAPILVPPQTVSLDAERPANPLEHSIIVIPVRIEEEVEFVLEVVQRASGGPAAQRGYLRFVAQMADLMADYLRRQSLREYATRAARTQQFEYWLTSISQVSNPSKQLRLAADGLAELLNSYQVFVVRSGRRPKVLAASGIDSFDPRSETILAAQLAEQSLQRLAASRDEYLDLNPWKSGDQRLASVSRLFELMASDRLVRLRVNEGNEIVALLGLSESPTVSPAEMKRVAASLFGLIDLRATQSDWIRKYWPFRSSIRTVEGLKRTSWQVWAMRAALTGLVTVIAFFPVPQQISTTAVLAPKQKNCYYAPVDATVTEIKVTGVENERVNKGDELLVLQSVALNQNISRLEDDATATLSHKEQVEFERSKAVQGSADFRKFDAELAQVLLKIKANENELAFLYEEKAKLTIKAREPGELTSWDIENRLQGRPVARGDLLLSTCDPNGEWELQVSIPEHRVGLVGDALVQAQSTTGTVPIRFSLTSHPNVLMDGGLTWMADQATRNASGSNVVLSKASVLGNLPLKKEGALAHVTINCGRVPAIWLVVRDAYWACVSRLKMIW